MVIYIVVASIIMWALAMTGVPLVLGFQNQVANTDLSGDMQMFERLKRELRGAAPNSFRTTIFAGKTFIEFAPVSEGGMYDPSTLSLYVVDNDFTVLGPSPTVSTCADCRVMIGQMGVPGADVYDAAAVSNVSRHPSGVAGSVITMDAGMWAETSAASRWSATNGPVSYELDPITGKITRYWGYGWQVSQPTSFIGFSALLSRNLCSVVVNNTPTANRRSGIEFHLRYCSPDRRNYSDMFQTIWIENTP